MKLYTEEQVKQMIDDAHNGIDGYYDIFKKHTPIVIPTDEEIEELGAELFDKVVYIDYEWIMGAKWMRDKIINQNKMNDEKGNPITYWGGKKDDVEKLAESVYGKGVKEDYEEGFVDGAKWMRDKIKGGNQ